MEKSGQTDGGTLITEIGEPEELKETVLREVQPYPRYVGRYWLSNRMLHWTLVYIFASAVTHLMACFIEMFWCEHNWAWAIDLLFCAVSAAVGYVIALKLIATASTNSSTFNEYVERREYAITNNHWLVIDDFERAMANMQRRAHFNPLREWWIIFVTNRAAHKRKCRCCLQNTYGFKKMKSSNPHDPAVPETVVYLYTQSCPYCGFNW